MLGLRPKPKRGLCPLHPGRGRPRGRSVKYSENYTLPSERKTYTNTLQFKNFWKLPGEARKHGVTGKSPFCKKGFPRSFLFPYPPRKIEDFLKKQALLDKIQNRLYCLQAKNVI